MDVESAIMQDDDDDVNQHDWKARMREVSETLRRHPYNIIEEMEKLGFRYVVDEDQGEAELSEERAACPINDNQQVLESYLEGTALPDKDVLASWRAEKDSPEPNYPLWRRYFRSGNKQLKSLLLVGLEIEPTDRDLLSDLSFMHVFAPMLKELIATYLIACDAEEDRARFIALARDFDEHTYASGYEALIELRSRYPLGSFKALCIARLLTEEIAQEGPSL